MTNYFYLLKLMINFLITIYRRYNAEIIVSRHILQIYNYKIHP